MKVLAVDSNEVVVAFGSNAADDPAAVGCTVDTRVDAVTVGLVPVFSNVIDVTSDGVAEVVEYVGFVVVVVFVIDVVSLLGVTIVVVVTLGVVVVVPTLVVTFNSTEVFCVMEIFSAVTSTAVEANSAVVVFVEIVVVVRLELVVDNVVMLNSNAADDIVPVD